MSNDTNARDGWEVGAESGGAGTQAYHNAGRWALGPGLAGRWGLGRGYDILPLILV
jgi:hypothetical protein